MAESLRSDYARKIDTSKFQVVEMKVNGKRFEILTNRDKVTQYRSQKCQFHDVLAAEIIFQDASKGTTVSEEAAKSAFNMEDLNAILKHMVEEGNLKLSSAERKALVEQKKNEVIYYITKNYVDPKGGRPHPRVRIENAFTEMKIRIDPDGSAESQGEAAVKKMRGPILFGRAAQLTGTVMIKHQYYGKVSHILGAYKFEKESWENPEGVTLSFSLTRFDVDRLMEGLAKPTGGDYDLKMDTGGMSAADDDSSKKKKKKKKDKKKKKKDKSKSKSS